LAEKKMVGNTSFKQDLTEKLTSMNYKDIGVSDEVVKQFDPTPNDGKVSKSDASAIVEKIMQDKEMLKDYMTDYFALYEEREFKNNIPSKLKNNQNQNAGDNDFQGGNVSSDGVWTPGS
jgi:hypothetical protein